MPRDHFVSQVHLKKFYSPTLGRLHAIRKSDFKSFSPRAEDTCFVPDGSTNRYLAEERAVEAMLKEIEPDYNWAVRQLEEGKSEPKAFQVLAGWIAYILSCSPAAMRLAQEPLKAQLATAAEILDAQGIFPPAPPELCGRRLPELICSGEAVTNVDRKFPQAIGINVMKEMADQFCQFAWDVMLNPLLSSPFFTSDYPVAIEATRDPRIVNRIVPLTPRLAVRIKPQLAVGAGVVPRHKAMTLSAKGVREVNALIVRCAEDNVFYSREEAWIPPFIKKHRHDRVESGTEVIRMGTGRLHLCTLRIMRREVSQPQPYGQ